MNRYEFDPQRIFMRNPFEGTDNISVDPLKGCKMGAFSPIVESIITKIETTVREDEENFIFETIGPYCDEVAQRKISKKDLKDAIRYWMDNGCPRAW